MSRAVSVLLSFCPLAAINILATISQGLCNLPIQPINEWGGGMGEWSLRIRDRDLGFRLRMLKLESFLTSTPHPGSSLQCPGGSLLSGLLSASRCDEVQRRLSVRCRVARPSSPGHLPAEAVSLLKRLHIITGNQK
ncbi:unnamed protein product [Pleuronectes platessa]|uniref:Secreted protein n=1 Tax=Pleuronectes platessa TaxID=8262 RepID=A0A9N7USU1_PLEPL|nr:unnamed protein product [Pleuronectes platessa]